MPFNFASMNVWDTLSTALKYIWLFAPAWLPAVFGVILFETWLRYKHAKFWQKEGSILLEIKLPREVAKSPAAMEVVMGVFNQGGGEGTWFDRIWKGQTRNWFSLEIASLEGKIHFYVWTAPKYKNVIEAQIYSQYPNVEIYEIEDYTKPFYHNPEKFEIWGAELQLTTKDAYPIKTYVDYGLANDPKEEFKIDPMTPLLEFLGTLSSGQNMWIQILIQAHKKRRVMGVFGEKEDAWKDEAKAEVAGIIEKLKKEGGGSFPRTPTLGEKTKMEALDRSISKLPFDCGIRIVYLTEKDKFNPTNIGGILGAWKQFGSPELNGFKPAGWLTGYDYPWQEWLYPKEPLKPRLLEEYKLRRYFHSPWKGKNHHVTKPFILNSEELATIFHFPGEVASTPTLEKIPSVKSKAPSNLPI